MSIQSFLATRYKSEKIAQSYFEKLAESSRKRNWPLSNLVSIDQSMFSFETLAALFFFLQASVAAYFR
jgi:hypothetical protein